MRVRRVVPNIPTTQPERSRAFYGDVLGLEVAMDRVLGDARILTLVSPDNPTAQVTLVGGAPATPVPTITVEIADIDAAYEGAVARGVPIVYPLTTEPWGVRHFHALDPDGVIVNVMTHVEAPGQRT